MGELLTRWAIRLALGMAAGAVAWTWWSENRGWRATRIMWTLGCLLALAHAVCAMIVYHEGSHLAALEATRRETREVLGINWGGGLYVNYAFLIAWSSESAWWWLDPTSLARSPPLLRHLWHATFAGMVFFGAVVFEQGPMRWLSLFGLLLTGAMALRIRIAPDLSEA